MLGNLKQSWQRLRRYLMTPAASQLRDLEHELARIQTEKQSLLAELRHVQDEVESARNRDTELLVTLNARIGAMEAARDAASQQIETLRTSLSDADKRQQETENRVSLLGQRLEKERREHLTRLQEMTARENRQHHRLNRAMLLAGFAVLLGTLASLARFRDIHQTAAILADLSSDIKDIKAAIDRQIGARQVPESLPPSPISEPADSLADGRARSGTDKQDAGRDRGAVLARQALPATGAAAGRFLPGDGRRSRNSMLAFFEENASEQGIITLSQGLQYRVLSRGNGRSPKATDSVILDYSAFLLDGTPLFSSFDEPLPVQFSVSQLVPGLREALPHMDEGAQWIVYVSPDQAYRGGTRNRRKYGYEPLVYMVELRSVVDAADAGPQE